MRYTITILIFLMLFVSTALAATYTATVPKDLDVATPTEGSTPPREMNDSVREVKVVEKNQYTMLSVGTTTTLTGTSTFIIGSSSTALTLNFPTASTIATSTCTKEYVILNRNTGTVTLNITVEGIAGSPTVSQNNSILLYTDGTTWFEKRVQNAYNATNFGNIGTSSFARSGANSDIKAISGLTTYLAIGQGGSGTNTAAGAASAFGVGTEDTPTLTGVVTTGSSTLTTLALSNGTVSGNLGISGSISGIEDADIPNDVTLTNLTQITTRNYNDLSGTSTISPTTATITTALITNGTVSGTLEITGSVTGLEDADIPNNATLNNLTQVTTRNYNDLSGTSTISPTTATITTASITNLSGNSGTWTGNLQAATASGFPHLTKIIVGGLEGTGSVTLAAGQGITYNMTTVAGSSTITITGVGTTSAGGWTDTGTQTIGLAGNQVLPHGTVTLDAAYGMTGLTDAWIPNTITLDNLTQITTRNYSALSGTSTISPTTATITTAVITNLTAPTGTITTLTGSTGTLTDAFRAGDFYGTATGLTGVGTTTSGADKIPLADGTGKLAWNWLGGIAGTVSTRIGTTAVSFTIAQDAELLLHMEGPNGTTTFTNHGYGTQTITAVADAKISTAAYKFNLGSGIFDGTDDRLNIPNAPIFPINANTKWDLSMQINPDVVTGDDGMWASANDTIVLKFKNSLLQTTFGTVSVTTTTPATGVWTQLYASYDGKIGRAFKGGIQYGTVTVSDTYIWVAGVNAIFVGDYAGGGFQYDGNMDELRFRVNPSQGFYTSNFGSETTAYNSEGAYTENTLLLFDAANNIPVLKFITPGTATAEKSYTFIPGSVTVFGATSTASIGTTTPGLAYGVPNAGAATFDAFNVHSVNEIKAGIESLEGKENNQKAKLLQMNSKSWHPKTRDIYVLDAEAVAKEEYVEKDYASWESANKSKYIVSVEMPGTGTVQVLDAEKMLQDFKAEKELLWASDLTQPLLVKEMQDMLESDKSITRLGFMVRDPLTPKEVIEGEAINLMSLVTLTVDAIKSQDAEIGSLTAALENQKIFYNEEVDNLYKLVSAVIVALLAIGGVSGWSTIRNKRKGT